MQGQVMKGSDPGDILVFEFEFLSTNKEHLNFIYSDNTDSDYASYQ